ncbi:MAG TPA: transglutaminase family protein [Gemmataceae bacterium]|nr:transglutaminase family protein [Gemmataceae bacterium]
MRMSDEELAVLGTGRVNLLCSVGVKRYDGRDIEQRLETIDRFAGRVKTQTDRALPKFRAKLHEFNHSEAYFRMLVMCTVLQQQCGVVYDPNKRGLGLGEGPPWEIDDEFLHGILEGKGGTCMTIPVLYVAVGRKLGYPLELVGTKNHGFCRWDDPVTGERFNIEATNLGLTTHPDNYYRNWPTKIDPEMEDEFHFLESMSPREELALFINGRANIFKDEDDWAQCVDAYIWASVVDPVRSMYPVMVRFIMREWEKHLRKGFPPQFPRIEIEVRSDRRRWPAERIPWPMERHIRMLETIQKCLDHPKHEEDWWRPLREGGQPKSRVPTWIRVDLTKEK